LAERSEAKNVKQSFKPIKNIHFDKNLRFAPLASLQSAIFSEN